VLSNWVPWSIDIFRNLIAYEMTEAQSFFCLSLLCWKYALPIV
jgi:hypothetical protein